MIELLLCELVAASAKQAHAEGRLSGKLFPSVVHTVSAVRDLRWLLTRGDWS